MAQTLMKRVEFATFAGVDPSAVTKACRGNLKPAIVSNRIDASHSCAREYVAAQRVKASPNEIDPLFARAAEYCAESGCNGIKALAKFLHVGQPRARKILEALRVARVIPRDAPARGTANEAGGSPPPSKAAAGSPAPPAPGDSSAQPPPPPLAAPGNGAAGTAVPVVYDLPDDIKAFLHMTLGEIIEGFGTLTAFVDLLAAGRSIEIINEKRLKNAATEGTLVSRDLVQVGILEPIEAAHVRLLRDGARTMATRAVAMAGAGKTIDEVEEFIQDQIGSFIRPVKAKTAKALKRA